MADEKPSDQNKGEWKKPDYYTGPQAAPYADAKDPFALFEAWFAEARTHEPNDPNAMALATVDPSGMPNVRVVLLKGLDDAAQADRGFVFYTNYEGAKGQELLASKQAALNFHWKSLRRQVRVRGPVTTVSSADADAYFATRPRGSQIGAWGSSQSRPMENRAAFEKIVADYTAKFGTGPVPRPPHALPSVAAMPLVPGRRRSCFLDACITLSNAFYSLH
jgi:pyridoxamine 5'-phosphate oxidase